MDSKAIYKNLCESRKVLAESYGPSSGLHRHHIVPKHAGGIDNEDNYTYLTPREHQIAHYLLWRIYRNPNDLRSMKMLGSKLTPLQRKITGEFCRDNGIGFYNEKWNHLRSDWREMGLESQKKAYEETGDKNNFYYWASPEGRKERSSLGGKASIVSNNNSKWKYWASPEGRKERSSLGGKAHKGKRCMHKPGDKTFKRVKPEDIDQYLEQGYIFGSPIKRGQL